MGEFLFNIGYKTNELKGMSAQGNWDQKVYQDLWLAYRIDRRDVTDIIGGNDKPVSCDVGPEAFAEREARLNEVFDKINVSKPRVDPFKTRLNDDGEAIGPLASKDEIKVLKKFGLYNEYQEQNAADNY